MNYIELAKQAGLKRHQEQAPGIDGVVGNWEDLERFAALVEAQEREACLKIIDNYEIPVGNSRAGEISCGMTYGALKDIHDAIRARGTT
ncbi:hypothetical protein UFOVP566_43 [uncultured Caudovirales phage]|uniref:Uncharacterized protein n=1 Tax=uncultured Caudovirales phage TaxID=2100421 RepID=A0A6J5MU92_9CAUD|nr:hypothetical protein UFOVP294_42 [uncultured Caudovirales phage]CAB4150474.1 hypothetical protein UFOVP566_43 [uncultured Caudovirales phage]